jgi:hypothetical protein
MFIEYMMDAVWKRRMAKLQKRRVYGLVFYSSALLRLIEFCIVRFSRFMIEEVLCPG